MNFSTGKTYRLYYSTGRHEDYETHTIFCTDNYDYAVSYRDRFNSINERRKKLARALDCGTVYGDNTPAQDNNYMIKHERLDINDCYIEEVPFRSAHPACK